jgi:cyclophilin family peptidyl-prolyl cis-trans isomerase
MNKNTYITIIIIVVVLAAIYFIFPSPHSSEAPSLKVVTPATTSPTSITTTTIATTTLTTPSKNNMHTITIETNKGTIVFETYDADAPNTVNNFISLASKGYYKDVIFHRVIKNFMIQGGDPTGTGRGGPGYTFADELNPATDSYKNGYKRGVVAMANAGPNTNGSQFFIMHQDTPLPNAYTIFGHVVSGMDVVDAIANVPVSGAVETQNRPLSDIVIKSVTPAEKK